MTRALGICDRIYLIVFTTLALLVLLVTRFTGDIGTEAIRMLMTGLFLVLFIVLSVRSFKIFRENNYSILFWFLYLCTLEVLPLGLLICALTRI